MNCTQCQSDNTQRIAVIYEQGTSDIHTSSTSVGFGGGAGGLAVGTASTRTRGTSQSKLAKKLAPPGHRATTLAIVGAVIVGGLGFMFTNANGALATMVAGFCFAGVAVCLAFAVYWERFVRPKQLAAWQRTWHCNRCGAVYAELGAYDAYNATKTTRQLYGGVTAAVVAVCLGVAVSSFDSVYAAQIATARASAGKSAHSSRFNARLNRDYELKSFEGTCTLPQGTAVADNGPLPNWKRLYKEPMANIAFDPSLCSKLGKHHNWVAPQSAIERQ